MSRKRLFYFFFFVILGLGFYFILTLVIPGFGKKNIPPVSFIRPFSFITQDGKPFTEKEVAGKIFVAEYFFTTCKGICPKMNNNMRLVYNRFKDRDDFYILSHTCNPETDSVAQMKKYADSMGVNTGRW